MNKQCNNCSKTFRINDQDLAFYKKIAVPEPTFCPDCRTQRRLAWRNERKFYERKCDLCGNITITIYHPNSPLSVYCQDCWWGDGWDPTSYGLQYNPNQSFFEQFFALQRAVPRLSLSNNQAENSPYMNWADHNSNCYMGTSGNYNEGCLYGFWMVGNTDCGDVAYSMDNRMCYELIDCTNCNQVRYSQDSRDCNESWLLYNCTGVSNCFGCTNLRMKEYYIFNMPYSPEEYTQKVADMTKDRESFAKAQQQFNDLKKKSIQKYAKGVKNINVTGGGITNSQNARYCFDVREVVDSAYCFDGLRTEDSYDLTFFDECELCYECHSVMGYGMKFANICRLSPGAEYSDSCHNASDIFGCVGLRKKQYHILNTPYSESEYTELRGRIIEKMKADGEYGEFFPADQSFFAYNETLAFDFFPMQEKEVTTRGWRWLNEDAKTSITAVAEIPDDIDQVDTETIIKRTFTCATCAHPFRMIRQEIELYKQFHVQLPLHCSNCRQQARERLRNPWKLYTRRCMCTQVDHDHDGRCSTEFETNYSPDATAVIYCEDCYQKEMY